MDGKKDSISITNYLIELLKRLADGGQADFNDVQRSILFFDIRLLMLLLSHPQIAVVHSLCWLQSLIRCINYKTKRKLKVSTGYYISATSDYYIRRQMKAGRYKMTAVLCLALVSTTTHKNALPSHREKE